MVLFLKKAVSILLIFLPVYFVFRKIFSLDLLVGGDAPHFFPSELKELVSPSSAWVFSENNFGGVNKIIYLWPLMFLYGFLGYYLKLGNEIAGRIIFYLPALAFSLFGPILLAKYLKLSKTVQFISALFYTLNTYFILLIDGGQIGVALAYSFFPITLTFLKKYLDRPSTKTFFLGVLILFLNTIFDPRVSIISIFIVGFWVVAEMLSTGNPKGVRKLFLFLPLLVTWLGLNFYWIYPTTQNKLATTGTFVTDLNLVTMLDTLFIFSPHWPANEFGKVNSPPVYFILIPILVFLPLLFKKRKKNFMFAFLFLISAFLAKGGSPPFGEYYSFVNNLPFGFAFRDASKFFAATVLFGGILIGQGVELLSLKLKSFSKTKPLWFLPHIFVYLFLLVLVAPALKGRLNFVLSLKDVSSDYQKIYEFLKNEESFFRTAWFSEKPGMVYEKESIPALSAKGLVNEKPLAGLNAGEDVFNFLNRSDYIDWLKVFGIKYLLLSGNPREITQSTESIKDWDRIKSLIGNTEDLLKREWGASFPIYEVPDPLPRIYAVDKLFAVVGGLDVYKYGEKTQSPFLANAFVFLEDGVFDPRILAGKHPDSVVVVFNAKSPQDLTMSFLQKYFVSPGHAASSEWARFDALEYLKWKYQLLIRDIETSEFDYGKGIALSTKPGEKIVFDFKVEEGEYVLTLRRLVKDSGNFQMTFNGELFEFGKISDKKFHWYVKDVKAKDGLNRLTIISSGGVDVLNTVALIPKVEWEKNMGLSTSIIKDFTKIITPQEHLCCLQEVYHRTDYKMISPAEYEIEKVEGGNWIIFTDSYHPLWKLKSGSQYSESIPIYSSLNGFYIDKGGVDSLSIEFEGQKNLKIGILMLLVMTFVVVTGLIFLKKRE